MKWMGYLLTRMASVNGVIITFYVPYYTKDYQLLHIGRHSIETTWMRLALDTSGEIRRCAMQAFTNIHNVVTHEWPGGHLHPQHVPYTKVKADMLVHGHTLSE